MDDSRLKEINEASIEDMETSVSKEMATNFLPKLARIVKIENEDQLIRINELVRLASATIQSRIGKNTRTRFINLTNIINESRTTSLEMMAKTGEALAKIDENSNKEKNKIKKSKNKVKKVA